MSHRIQSESIMALDVGIEKQPKPPLPDPDVALERILDVYDRATDRHQLAGVRWYQDAHEIAVEMHDAYPDRLQSVVHAAGLIAALSPNEAWTTNVRNAWTFLATGVSPSLPRSQEDSKLIINGFDPEWVLFGRGKKNFKVQSFFSNIANPDSSGPVTIDRHAKGIVYDDPRIAKVKPHATRQEYDFYELMYTKAAAEVGIMPHQLQAVTWLAWRGLTQAEATEQLQIQF